MDIMLLLHNVVEVLAFFFVDVVAWYCCSSIPKSKACAEVRSSED
uniref:E3 ubiquitin-protein ligase BRE1-like 1 n=1 Tax=Rhizophora mucronata TaxID=61149 RepID=A0A2P2J7P0_RHIMU